MEQERYGEAAYPSDVLRAGRRPLVQFPLATLEATMAKPLEARIPGPTAITSPCCGFPEPYRE